MKEQTSAVNFDFLDEENNPVQGKEIPFEHLMLTKDLTEGDKKMKASKKYHHFEIIKMVSDMIGEAGLPVMLDPIIVAKSDAAYHDNVFTRRGIEEGMGNIHGWVFRRLVARFHSPIQGIDRYNPSIGIGYNMDGLTFCYGTNVRVCSNMCILGGTRISTYGNDGVAVEKAINILRLYIKEMEERFHKDIEIFNRMEGITIPGRAGMAELIGEMNLAMNYKNNLDMKFSAPLDSGELNRFATTYLRDYSKGMDQRADVPLFDVYQIGTQILTSSVTNIHNKWHDIEDFGDFFTDRFDLN
jgi:hypothetical protein